MNADDSQQNLYGQRNDSKLNGSMMSGKRTTGGSVHENLYNQTWQLREKQERKAKMLHMKECPFVPDILNKSQDNLPNTEESTAEKLNKSFDNFYQRNQEYSKYKEEKLKQLV